MVNPFSAMSLAWKVGLGVAVVMAIGGAGVVGYVKGSAAADVEIAEFQADYAGLQNDYNELVQNPLIETVVEYRDRWHTITQTQTEYVQVAADVPSGGELSNGWITTHNLAALGQPVDRNAARDSTPSGVRDNQALPTITGNYAQYQQCVAQLTALQNVINTHNNAIDRLNEGNK